MVAQSDHRHARPHQRDGDRGAALPEAYPPETLAPRRRPAHQRSLDDERPDQRHHHPDAGLPERAAGGVLRQHLPRGGHRRADPLG